MNFILKNTDIFDDGLYEKVANELNKLKDWHDPKLYYELSVVFSVRLNQDNRINGFYAKLPKKEYQSNKEITHQDIVREVLSYQLQKIIDAFQNYNRIRFDHASILGRIMKSDTTIQILIEPKGNITTKKKISVHSIIPDEAGIIEKATEILGEYYNKQFEVIVKKIGIELLTEILEVENHYEDMNLLFNTYIHEYGTFFATEEEREQLAEKFKRKAMEIAAKHSLL